MTEKERQEMMHNNWSAQMNGLGFDESGYMLDLKNPVKLDPNVFDFGSLVIYAKEEADKFIFTTVQPYCELATEKKISKKILERALFEYFQNHPEEREGR